MKHLKTLLIIAAVIGLAAYAGQNIVIETARLDGFMYGNKSGGIDSLIVPDVDSLGQYKYQNAKDPINPLDLVNFRTLLSAGAAGVDSIPFNPATGDQVMWFSGSPIYTTNFNGILPTILSEYVAFTDTVSTIATKTDLLALATATKNVYRVILPVASLLSTSVAAAVEDSAPGVEDGDYPFGWVLTASGSDLQISHGLGRYSYTVNVFSDESAGMWRQYRNFQEGYSGILLVDDDNINVESVNNDFTLVRIKIVIAFE